MIALDSRLGSTSWIHVLHLAEALTRFVLGLRATVRRDPYKLRFFIYQAATQVFVRYGVQLASAGHACSADRHLPTGNDEATGACDARP